MGLESYFQKVFDRFNGRAPCGIPDAGPEPYPDQPIKGLGQGRKGGFFDHRIRENLRPGRFQLRCVKIGIKGQDSNDTDILDVKPEIVSGLPSDIGAFSISQPLF